MIRRMVLAVALAVAGLGLAGLGPAMSAAALAADPYETSRITVRVRGQGPDVLLIPGMTSSPEAWATVMPLADGYRYHLVQVKGFAGTRADGNLPNDGRVIAHLADALARYAADQKIRPAVVGHSMGGTIALMMAARHPEAVSRLMVVDMVPFLGVFLGGTTAETALPLARANEQRLTGLSPVQWTDTVTAMTAAMVNNVQKRPLVVNQALASDRALVATAFTELYATDLRAELPRIAVPATVLYVTPAGGVVTDAQIDAIYRAQYAGLKGVTLERAPDSAHFIMFDNPDWFARRLRAFLQP